MATEERKNTHFMTEAISESYMKAFHIRGTPTIAEILKLRPPRIATPQGFAPFDSVKDTMEYDFETVYINNYADAYQALKSGEADVFLTMNVAEPAFDIYGDVVSETFYPLVFAPTSLSTQISGLEPIITVVQKALENGGASYLAELYSQGHRDYISNKFLGRLTLEELVYMQRNPVVKIATETDHYPISFYNNNENELQGIAFDIMREIEEITGLSFEVTNTLGTNYIDLIYMVENGEASLLTMVMRSREQERRFLLPEKAIMRENSVLISKNEYPNVQFNELADVKVGIVRGTIQAELFKRWFPNNTSFSEYDNMDSVFNALQRGEVDMLMSVANYLLSIENYKELAGFKTNVVFDNTFDLAFGLNKDEVILCSIVDKALQLIDLETIAGYWTHKRYDYRAKVAEAQRPWLIGATALSLAVLALILALLYRSRNEGKRLEKVVSEKTAFLASILDATPDIIFCKDLNSRTTECNKASEDYFNVPKEQIIGSDDTKALGWTPEVQRQRIAVDARVMNEKQVIILEEYIQSSSGEQRLFETIKSPLIQGDKVTGLVGMSRDIRRRKAAEDEAKNASKAKSRFVANMSHEMRTPMNVIVGLTDLMLEEEGTPGNIKETLKKINTAGNTLMGLINDVLDISKVEAGKLELMPVEYDVPSLLNDIITLNTIRIGEKPIVFKLDINEELPATLFGDDLRIKQVLNNLLSNAFKYTKEGTVTLGVSVHTGDTSHSPLPTPHSLAIWITFYVSDTGIGIREEDVAKLFTDYNQVDTRANRAIEGTGLGLSITKKFVGLMGGEISVESEYGKGTTFCVRIPQGFVTAKPIGKEVIENLQSFHYADKKKSAQEKLVRANLRYARVLVVDDFPMNLDVAAGMLRKYKMTVDCVLSGQEAVNLIAAGRPVYDAVFMDHMMPEMDGIQATKIIRALGKEYAEKVPIIALTANAVAGNEQMFLDNGFNAFLSKPINVMTLDAIIQKWVRNKAKEE
jgi:PAS domain S-box-containing protein